MPARPARMLLLRNVYNVPPSLYSPWDALDHILIDKPVDHAGPA